MPKRIKTARRHKLTCEGNKGRALMQQGHTVFFENGPKIVATATVAGPKECEGIVGKYVDFPLSDDMFGESTFERAERKMFLTAVERSVEKAGITVCWLTGMCISTTGRSGPTVTMTTLRSTW